MQLIVGCRARGASWVGSETLVIPGKRLTIHVRAPECVHGTYTRLLISRLCVRIQGGSFCVHLIFMNKYSNKNLRMYI